MDSKIFKFNKSYEQRYQEYCVILRKSDCDVTTASEVTLTWSNYLELSVERRGWNALWNILRKDCDKLHVRFPKVVHVMVNEINFDSLTTDISLLDADDEEFDQFPSIITEVPLKDLYVTYEQENPHLDVTTTAECLDQLRIFYHHLWWPWDDDAFHIQYRNWAACHLESRLKLYYDRLQGKVHYVSGKIIKRLIENSQEIYAKLQHICPGKSILDVHEEVLDRSPDNATFLSEAHRELALNRSELQKWGVLEIRKMLNTVIEETHRESGIFLVVQECSMKDVAEYFNQLPQLYLPYSKIKCISSGLEDSLLNSNVEDVILMAPGDYVLTHREYFDFTITIKGLDRVGKTTINDKRSYWCIFESLAPSVTIDNISFNMTYCRSVMIVKRGVLNLSSVNLENQNSEDSVAIYVYKNGTLVADRCSFSNFNIAVICLSGATVRFSDCIFKNNNSCLQIAEGARVTLNNCDVSRSNEAPFKYEVNVLEEQRKPLNYLSEIECIKFNMVKVADETNAVELI